MWTCTVVGTPNALRRLISDKNLNCSSSQYLEATTITYMLSTNLLAKQVLSMPVKVSNEDVQHFNGARFITYRIITHVL